MSQCMPGIAKNRMPSPVDSDNVLLVFTTFAFTLASAGSYHQVQNQDPFLQSFLSYYHPELHPSYFSSARISSTLLLRTYDVEQYHLGLCFDHDNGPC